MLSRYKFKGVCLESEFALPQLQLSECAPQVRLRVAAISPPTLRGEPIPNWTQVDRDEAIFVWEDLGVVRIRQGREIVVDAHAGASLELLHAGLLGPVFSALTAQRGFFPLHASSLELGSSAIAISGAPGAGKSSLAAGLVQRGHALIADDVSTIEMRAGEPVVHGGMPRLRLTDATLAWSRLTSDGVQVPAQMQDGLEPKLYCPVPGVTPQVPIALARIYLIADGSETRIDALSQREAFFSLAQNGHQPAILVGTFGQAGFMQQCTQLAQRVPVFRLTRPRQFDRMSESVRALEAHAGL